MNDRIIFVGMHNKPGMKPLDSKTVSGRIIDAIIERLPITSIKSNLSEKDYLPICQQEILDSNTSWQQKYAPNKDTIIVLLGGWVVKNFIKTDGTVIKLRHPASMFGKDRKLIYIEYAVMKIKEAYESILPSP